jgi:2,4-dienoyl-CoA reductase-like NADH-dependent reductase (Old Yellow Enzyme family)
MDTPAKVFTDVFGEAKLGPVTLRNRIIKAATFEASTPDALVTDDLIRYHRLPARACGPRRSTPPPAA